MSANIEMSTTLDEIAAPFDYAVVGEFADALKETAEKIRTRNFECLIDNGRDLLEWRDRLKHGQFSRWVKSECGISVRLAELAMMVAKYADANAKHEIISRLPPTLQYFIVAPSTPEPVRERVLEYYAEGRRLTVEAVKQMVRAAKGESSQATRFPRDRSNDLMPIGQHLDRARGAEVQATAHQWAASPSEDQGDESLLGFAGSKMAETRSPPELTSRDQSDRPLLEEERTAYMQAGEAQATTAVQPATPPVKGRAYGPGGDHLDLDVPESDSADANGSSGYIENIIEILGTEVTSKGLLINLLHRAGYPALARALDAYEKKRVAAAA